MSFSDRTSPARRIFFTNINRGNRLGYTPRHQQRATSSSLVNIAEDHRQHRHQLSWSSSTPTGIFFDTVQMNAEYPG
jgi:hypothetical protein